MADKMKFEDISSFSKERTISFPALNDKVKGRVRLFIYFSVLVLFSFGFLVAGYQFSAYNYSLINTETENEQTDFVANTIKNGQTDLTHILECTVDISIFNDRYLSEATGVIISSDGYIVTNDHIYQDVASPTVFVFDSNGNKYQAQFVAGDSKYDVSILKIDAQNLPYMTFYSSNELKKGDEIYSIGRGGSVTKGIVSEYVYEASGQSKSVKMIRTDCAVNPGDSGGPVVADGKLVALNCSKTVSLDVEGMSYLLPSDTVLRAVEQLINNQKIVDRAVLGITYKYISPVLAMQDNCISGIRIDVIGGDSDLYGKGFSEGDVIVAVDGKDITSEDIFLDFLSGHVAGDIAQLTIKKINGTDRKVEILLSADSSFSSYSNE